LKQQQQQLLLDQQNAGQQAQYCQKQEEDIMSVAQEQSDEQQLQGLPQVQVHITSPLTSQQTLFEPQSKQQPCQPEQQKDQQQLGLQVCQVPAPSMQAAVSQHQEQLTQSLQLQRFSSLPYGQQHMLSACVQPSQHLSQQQFSQLYQQLQTLQSTVSAPGRLQGFPAGPKQAMLVSAQQAHSGAGTPSSGFIQAVRR